MRLLLLWALAACLWSGTAQAEWHRASSKHFVIYADDKPDDVEKFAEILERYHLAMEALTGRKIAAPSPSNRVTIYTVGSQRDMRRLTGNKRIGGFYAPRAGGSSAFVQDVRFGGRETDFSLIVLLHEYAHHFLMSSSRFATPRWMNEGSAEFFASARFKRSGELEIGRPAVHRAGDLFYAKTIKLRDLLRYERPEGSSDEEYNFYGRSWLLYHYLTFNNERQGQVAAYWQAMHGGLDPVEAGEKIFGDLDQLDKELDNYLGDRMSMLVFEADRLVPGPVEVHALSKGMNAALPLIIQTKRGVDPDMAAKLLPEIRKVARQYPADADVLAALAEAEYDAGNDAEAIAAADAAIARDPSIANAYIQKGYALFRMADDATDQATAYKKAMAPFSALNAREKDHPLPLIYYYRSYLDQDLEPSETAKNALFQASQLAPFDDEVTFQTAIMYAQEGNLVMARDYLKPLANTPHGGPISRMSHAIIDAMAEAPEGVSFRIDYANLLETLPAPSTDSTEGED